MNLPPRLAATSVLLAVGMLAVLGPTGPAVADPATLSVEYDFDAVDEFGVVTDVTGAGHQLTLSGGWSVTDGISTPAVAFEHSSIGTTPDAPDLNPGLQEFAVTTVLRVPGDMSDIPDTPNVIQKGLYADRGQWKMQLKPVPGVVQCRLKGTLRAKLVTSSVPIDDGAWHTATCWRQGSLVGVTVDGVTKQAKINVGSIANSRPMTVGDKSSTAYTDQFVGSLDYAAVALGDGAADRSRVNAPVPAAP